MVSQTVYFTGMMFFTLTSQMYHRISVLVPVLVRVPEYLFTSTSTGTIALELTGTSKVRVPEIQCSNTASTSTEHEYPSPARHPQAGGGLSCPALRYCHTSQQTNAHFKIGKCIHNGHVHFSTNLFEKTFLSILLCPFILTSGARWRMGHIPFILKDSQISLQSGS